MTFLNNIFIALGRPLPLMILQKVGGGNVQNSHSLSVFGSDIQLIKCMKRPLAKMYQFNLVGDKEPLEYSRLKKTLCKL